MALATVLIPTHDHGPTLRHAVASVLGQTVEDLDVVIVGDGMAPEAAEIAREVAATDARVRLVELPKGPRHGELHRHAVLQEATAPLVFYLSDDDLWFPEHVETLAGLLARDEADFVTGRCAARLGDGSWGLAAVDLRLEGHRLLMQAGHNRVGLSDGAHTLEAYRRLPHGWRTTPRPTPTDLHMWRQWLDEPWVRFTAAPLPTGLHFPSHERTSMTLEQRVAEMAAHMPVLGDLAARQAWTTRVLSDEFARTAWLEGHWPAQAEWLADRTAALEWHVARLAEAAAALEWLKARGPRA